MKRTIINISLVLIVFVIYFLQSNFFNWFTISGVMPNVFVIFVLFVGLFANKTMGVVYGVFTGLIWDFSIGRQVGINAVCLGIIGLIAVVFDKNFSKDSRATIMFMTLGETIIFEIISYIVNYAIFNTNVEFINFMKILAIESIYNIILVIILYPLIQKFGYYIENEYKGNKILTRYF